MDIRARFSETAGNNNLFLSCGVYIFNGTTLQKTILTRSNGNTEVVASTLTCRFITKATDAGNYTTVSGDRIVVEVGLEGDPTSSNTHNGAMSYGSDSAT